MPTLRLLGEVARDAHTVHTQRMPVHIVTGTGFGQFVFLRYTAARQGLFRCASCNEEKERRIRDVQSGRVRNCQRCARWVTKHGHAATGHETATYEAWSAMKKRCLNPEHRNFRDYGGRGIAVCARWLTFANFLADMGERPAGMSLDRIDNSAGYDPANCRWATVREQNNNKRGNTLLSFNGEVRTISQWSELIGIKDCTLSERLRRGWSVERTLSTPVRRRVHRRAHASVPPAA